MGKIRFYVAVVMCGFLLSCVSSGERPSVTPDHEMRNPKIAEVENGLGLTVLVKGQTQTPWHLLDRMKHHMVPGVSIAVINNGRVEWAQAYGIADKESRSPVTEQTRFQAASISKAVAALGALTFVQKGVLNLDQPIDRHLRSWKIPRNDLSKSHSITLRQILSHSAGLSVHGFDGYERGKVDLPTLPQILSGVAPANSEAVQMIYVPGKRVSYSGGGFEIMELLLTDVTGLPFHQLMRDSVLLPLRMDASTFELNPAQDLAAFATGYDGKGEQIPGQWHVYPESAAAGLWTTSGDLAKFVIELQSAVKNQSKLGVSAKLANEATSRIIEDRGLGVAVWGQGRDRYFTHSGSNKGFKCLFVGYAELGLGAVIMTNGDGGQRLSSEIMASIAKVYQWPGYLTEVVR